MILVVWLPGPDIIQLNSAVVTTRQGGTLLKVTMTIDEISMKMTKFDSIDEE